MSILIKCTNLIIARIKNKIGVDQHQGKEDTEPHLQNTKYTIILHKRSIPDVTDVTFASGTITQHKLAILMKKIRLLQFTNQRT